MADGDVPSAHSSVVSNGAEPKQRRHDGGHMPEQSDPQSPLDGQTTDPAAPLSRHEERVGHEDPALVGSAEPAAILVDQGPPVLGAGAITVGGRGRYGDRVFS